MFDSVEKIVTLYLGSITNEPFTYKKKEYAPKLLRISPLLYRGYTCPSDCGGCCKGYTMDYLPDEKKPPDVVERKICINDRTVIVYSDMQEGNLGYYCHHVCEKDGRCGIHKVRAFSCDFELTRFRQGKKCTNLTTQMYGRGWNMRRVDGERGGLCKIFPLTAKNKDEVMLDLLRKMNRLRDWANHFGLDTKIDAIIHQVETGPHPEPIFI